MNLPVARSGAQPLHVALACAADAMHTSRQEFGHAKVEAVKGRGNVVTDVDLKVEQLVRARLQREYPQHTILSEETGSDAASDGWMWVVDPLDGTKNFSRGIPHFGFSIALCLENEPVVGVIAQPAVGELFTAIRGEGTYLNGHRVRVSEIAAVRDGVIAIDLGYNDARARRQIELAAALWPVQALRVAGSAALGLAYVAAGRWDLFVHLDLQPWDSAAGLLLVEEAGGTVTARSGEPATIYSSALAAGTPGVHEDFMRLAQELPWQA